MKIHLCVVGKLRNGPEKNLIDDYLNRFEKIGRSYGLGPVSVNEVEDKKNGGMSNEAVLLQRIIPKGAVVIALDERGEVVSSPNFSEKLITYVADRKGHDWRYAIDNAKICKELGWRPVQDFKSFLKSTVSFLLEAV